MSGQLWFTHELGVERLLGQTASGVAYQAATTELAQIEDQRRLVIDSTGEQVVSNSTVRLAGDVAPIPPGSRVTMPARFGGRVTTVIAVSVWDAGDSLPLEPYVELAVE